MNTEQIRVRDYPQLAVRIRPDQRDALNRLLSHGMKTPLFEVLVDEVIQLLDGPKGAFYLGLLIDGKMKLKDILQVNAEERDGQG